MAKQKNGISKSAHIRQVLKASPKMKAKEVVAALAATGIKVNEGLVYAVKGYLKGRKGRRRKLQKQVANGTATTGNADALTTIRKVKGLASDVGGMNKLKALVEALSE